MKSIKIQKGPVTASAKLTTIGNISVQLIYDDFQSGSVQEIAQFIEDQTNDMLIDLPLTDIQNFKFDDYRPIATTPLLRAKEEFKLELEFPKGVNVPIKEGVSMYLRLEFRVTEAKK